MNPNEMLTTTKETIELLSPAIRAFFGDAAVATGHTFGDITRFLRYSLTLRMLNKAGKMATDAGFTPKAVPIKYLFPILEGASLEENDDLQNMWASLLANAADPKEGSRLVQPGFASILKSMSPEEAVVLNFIYGRTEDEQTYIVDASPLDLKDLPVCLDSLEAAQLIRRSDAEPNPGIIFDTYPEVYGRAPSPQMTGASRAAVYAMRANKGYLLTDRGRAFIEACRPPEASFQS